MTHPLSAAATLRADRKNGPKGSSRGRATAKAKNFWIIVGKMVNEIPDTEVRQVVANHAAQFFLKHIDKFNLQHWSGSTGGQLTGPTTLAELREKA